MYMTVDAGIQLISIQLNIQDILWPDIIEFPSIFPSIESISRDTPELERNRMSFPAKGETTETVGSTIGDSAARVRNARDKNRESERREKERTREKV